MASFDEIRAKLRGKYGDKDEEIDDKYVKDFFSEASSFLQSAESTYGGMNFDNQNDVYNSWHERSNDLRSRSYKIRGYLKRNRDRFDEESYNSLMASLDDFDRASTSADYALYQNKEWSYKYDTKEDYDTAVKEGWLPIFEGFRP